MRALLLAAALAAPLSSSAQDTPADVWPLAPGNTWTYVRTSGQFRGPGAPGGIGHGGAGSSSVSGATTWTVVDSVNTADGRLPRLRIETSGTAAADCLVRSAMSESAFSFTLLNASGTSTCTAAGVPTNAAGAGGLAVARAVTAGDVTVGGQTLPGRQNRSGSDAASSTSVIWRTTDGLGVTFFSQTLKTGSQPETTTTNAWQLRRATVGGVTVGQPLGTRADFWPLEAGNRWEFRVVDGLGESVGEVVWTAEASGSGVALRMQHVRAGTVVSAVTCPLRRIEASPATGWETRFAFTACTLPEPFLAPTPREREPVQPLAIDVFSSGQAVVIGAQSVTSDVAAGGQRINVGIANDLYTLYTFARGIGPVGYEVQNVELMTQRQRWTARLAFARVGGTTYGQQVVAGDGEPDAAAVAFTAGPNPARGALALSFTLPAPGDASAEVFDALGRSVLHADLGARAAGTGTARLDVSGLAPGVYVVRLASGEVQASTRISVVR